MVAGVLCTPQAKATSITIIEEEESLARHVCLMTHHLQYIYFGGHHRYMLNLAPASMSLSNN